MTRLSIWNDLRPFSVGFDDLFDHFNNTLELSFQPIQLKAKLCCLHLKHKRFTWKQNLAYTIRSIKPLNTSSSIDQRGSFKDTSAEKVISILKQLN